MPHIFGNNVLPSAVLSSFSSRPGPGLSQDCDCLPDPGNENEFVVDELPRLLLVDLSPC